MKQRYGFVSNSSSSSFIVGIAKVDNLDTFQKLKSKHGGHKYGPIRFLSGVDLDMLTREKFKHVFINPKHNYVTISGGGNRGVDVSVPYDEFANYIVVRFNNDEGDYAFMDDDDEFDYDIDLSWFSDIQQEYYNIVSSFPIHDITFGAERNG